MSVLDILPPSPPTTSHRRHRVSVPHLSKPVTNTPDDSPASLLPSSSGNGSRKRVEFSPWTNVLEGSGTDQATDGSNLKALPKSRDCRGIAKSILKPQLEQPTSLPGGETKDVPATVTMDSLVQALGNNDKITSLDAYQSLAQLIKSWNEVPEDLDIRSHVTAIARSIQRDLAGQEQGSATPNDLNLITQALKVTVILVWSEQFSPLLPEDFKIFITDRAVTILSEHSAPKVVVVHYMHVLATQSFRSALFNSGTRTVKLLGALREITNHVQGKGTTAERLLIYQKLLEQAKPIMKAKAGLWIREVLLGLCSTVKEIRDKAISVCSKSIIAFPSSSIVSQAAREALGEEAKDRSLSETLTQRLERMITAKDEALQVPQIWALVMLLCSSAESRIDNWSLVRDWLRVIQRCFNCSDISVRTQAFPAWNRFIYIIKPHEATEGMMSMLAKPIAVQIERTGASASSKGSRPAAISSYCTLLYYAFRPAASHKQYTKAWNEYVVKIATSSFLSKSTANADLCCRVLMALFWKDGSASRIWNEARALDNKSMDPEELPALDCKWIRSKSDAILEIFKLLFKYSAWGPSVQYSDQAFVAKAWRAFTKAIRESASKEIKPSTETKRALLNIVAFIAEAHETEEVEHDVPSTSYLRAEISCNITVSELGVLTLLEVLDINTSRHCPDVLLSAILAYAIDSLAVGEVNTGQDNIDGDEARFDKPLSVPVQRSLAMLNDRLQKYYLSVESSGTALINLLEISAKTIERIQDRFVLRCLRSLDASLALIMEDNRCLFSTTITDSASVATYVKLATALVDKLSKISPSSYTDLDYLLASLLNSTNDIVTKGILQMWGGTSWAGTKGQYGILLTTAVADMREEVYVNLPGLATGRKNTVDQSQLARTSFTETPAIDHQRDAANGPKFPHDRTPNQRPPNALHKRRGEGRETPVGGQATDKDLLLKRPKHDDSQLHFTVIDSSPTKLDQVESQFLTERQKDVRTRQRSEQAVVFADLRSSPTVMINRSSRATSVDCEMARKLAASENLPTTPTLARHAGAMDDEEMPSPTPRARHSTSRIAEIEVVSSPPSVAANRSIDISCTDESLTALDPARMEDANVLNLEQMHEDASDNQLESCLQRTRATRSLRSAIKAQSVEIEHGVTHPIVLSDGPQLDAEMSINDLEVSQLSNDLDRPGLDQSKANDDNHGEATTIRAPCRKRKRTIVNYAEISGQHTRKRPSTGKNGSESDELSQVSSIIPEQNGLQRTDISAEHLEIAQAHAVDVAEKIKVEKAVDSQASSSSSGSQKRAVRLRKVRRNSRKPRNSTEIASNANELGNGVQPVSVDGQIGLDLNAELAPRLDEQAEAMKKGNARPSEQMNETPNTGLHQVDIMKALQTALTGLEHSDTAQKIDLKAIDELCFKIRFKAQEIGQNR